jgi:hypothetical protein
VEEAEASKLHRSYLRINKRRKPSLVTSASPSDAEGVVLLLMFLASAVMAVAAIVERRLGASAAGWVAALPIAFAVAAIAVGVDMGERAAAMIALSAAGHVAAQVAFAVGFVAALRSCGLLVGLLAGATCYAVASLVLAGIPPAAAAAMAIPALLVGPRLLQAYGAHTTARRPQHKVALTCAVAALIVGGVVLASRFVGPVAAGAIGAFPTMSATLAISLGRTSGRPAAARALQGLVRSLPCYLAFCLAIAVTAPTVGLLPSVAAALVGCVVTGQLTWRTVRMPLTVTPAREATTVAGASGAAGRPAGHRGIGRPGRPATRARRRCPVGTAGARRSIWPGRRGETSHGRWGRAAVAGTGSRAVGVAGRRPYAWCAAVQCPS